MMEEKSIDAMQKLVTRKEEDYRVAIMIINLLAKENVKIQDVHGIFYTANRIMRFPVKQALSEAISQLVRPVAP